MESPIGRGHFWEPVGGPDPTPKHNQAGARLIRARAWFVRIRRDGRNFPALRDFRVWDGFGGKSQGFYGDFDRYDIPVLARWSGTPLAARGGQTDKASAKDGECRRFGSCRKGTSDE